MEHPTEQPAKPQTPWHRGYLGTTLSIIAIIILTCSITTAIISYDINSRETEQRRRDAAWEATRAKEKQDRAEKQQAADEAERNYQPTTTDLTTYEHLKEAEYKSTIRKPTLKIGSKVYIKYTDEYGTIHSHDYLGTIVATTTDQPPVYEVRYHHLIRYINSHDHTDFHTAKFTADELTPPYIAETWYDPTIKKKRTFTYYTDFYTKPRKQP